MFYGLVMNELPLGLYELFVAHECNSTIPIFEQDNIQQFFSFSSIALYSYSLFSLAERDPHRGKAPLQSQYNFPSRVLLSS